MVTTGPYNRDMRRVLVPQVNLGKLPLSREQVHHLRDVLRLSDGTTVEAFDAAGRIGRGILSGEAIDVESMQETRKTLRWTVASAIPKGDRADWMVEKLSELGCARLIPLRTERSVVHPEGASKRQRWERIAQESAQQSKRPGVMQIAGLTDLATFLRTAPSTAWYLSMTDGSLPAAAAVERAPGVDELTLLIGPEGGWSEDELRRFEGAGLTPVSLGPTILRVETAAVAAGAIVAAFLSARSPA